VVDCNQTCWISSKNPLKRQRRKRKIPLSIASIEEWRGGRQNLVQLFPCFDFRAENYSNVKNFPVRWGAEQETQQVNHRTRMNREQCWVWHYSVIVVSLAVINVMSFSLLLVLFAHCCDFKPQRRMRICARPFCFNSTRLWWFFPHCHILLLPPQLYILLSHGILSVKTMPSLLVRPRSLAGSERVRHVHGTTQRNGNFFRLLDLKLFQVFALICAENCYSPSLFIPIVMHFFNRQAWHWFRWALSTTQRPVPAWHLATTRHRKKRQRIKFTE
jgi:hypothetical protein